MNQDASCSTPTQEEALEANFKPYVSCFAQVVQTNCFVDKTNILKDIFNNKSETHLLITAPRLFGKSTIVDMVKRFVEMQVDADGVVLRGEASPNYKLFKDNKLLIAQDVAFFDKHFSSRPVIHASFKNAAGGTFDEILDGFRCVLRDTFTQHEYLINHLEDEQKELFKQFCDVRLCLSLSKIDVETGLKFLSECLCKFFGKKVFVLIDEFDAPIKCAMFVESIKIDQVNKLLSDIFSNALEGNYSVKWSLLTGISYFASVELTGVANMKKYLFLTGHRFVPYYGLTEKEVDGLLTKFNIDEDTKGKVKLHYAGCFSLNGIKIFSIWSILNFLQKREIKDAWTDSGEITNTQAALYLSGDCLDVNILSQIKIPRITKLRELCFQETDYY